MRRAPYPLSGRPNPVVCGRKFCPGCGCWRLAMDFPASTWDPLVLSSRCRACRRTEHRQRTRTDPEYARKRRDYHREYAERERRANGALPRAEWEAGRAQVIECGRKFCTRCGRWRLLLDFYLLPEGRYAGMCESCKRVRARELYREHRADATWVALRREYDRIYKEAQRRLAGIPERRWVNGRQLPNEAHQGWTLSTEPVAAIVRQWMRAGIDRSLGQLALTSGVPERRIYDVLHGERISVPVADRLVVAMGTHLDLLEGAA